MSPAFKLLTFVAENVLSIFTIAPVAFYTVRLSPINPFTVTDVKNG